MAAVPVLGVAKTASMHLAAGNETVEVPGDRVEELLSPIARLEVDWDEKWSSHPVGCAAKRSASVLGASSPMVMRCDVWLTTRVV